MNKTDPSEAVSIAQHFWLRVSFADGWYHVWDLGGWVASTDDPQQLQQWLEHQSTSRTFHALRELLRPGSYNEKLAALGYRGTAALPNQGAIIERRPRHPARQQLEAKTGNDLLKELGL